MKQLKILFACLVMAMFLLPQAARSQAIVQEGDLWYWETDYDGYYTYETHEVYTPSGNCSIILYFYLDMNDPLVPEFGLNKIYTEGGWEIWINVDGVALAKKHINGKDKPKEP
jgi:hypothetical protein